MALAQHSWPILINENYEYKWHRRHGCMKIYENTAKKFILETEWQTNFSRFGLRIRDTEFRCLHVNTPSTPPLLRPPSIGPLVHWSMVHWSNRRRPDTNLNSYPLIWDIYIYMVDRSYNDRAIKTIMWVPNLCDGKQLYTMIRTRKSRLRSSRAGEHRVSQSHNHLVMGTLVPLWYTLSYSWWMDESSPNFM